MGVDRIILVLAIIRVVENQPLSYGNGGSTCDGLQSKYLFVLNLAANEINLLTDLVDSAKSAIVRGPAIDEHTVQVVVSPEDFTSFQKKSQALKVYKSHSLQCIDPKTNHPSFQMNTHRSSASWAASNGTAKKNSSIEVTTLLASKTTKKIDEQICKPSDDCKMEFRKNLTKVSPSNDVEKLSKSSAPLNTIYVRSANARISRASKLIAKHPINETSELKSKKNSTSKLPTEKTHQKSKEQKITTKNNDGRRNSSDKKKEANYKKNVFKTNIPLSQEHLSSLMNMAAESLSKYNNSSKSWNIVEEIKNRSMVPGRFIFFTNVFNARNKVGARKHSFKNERGWNLKDARKSAVKTKKFLLHKPKSSSTHNRAGQQRKSHSKTQGRKKSSSVVSTVTRKTIVNGSRNSRELKISAGLQTNYSINHLMKFRKSVKHYVKRDLTLHTPLVCVKISNLCNNDCSDENEETIPETVVEDSTDVTSSVVPENSSVSGQEVAPVNPPINTEPPESLGNNEETHPINTEPPESLGNHDETHPINTEPPVSLENHEDDHPNHMEPPVSLENHEEDHPNHMEPPVSLENHEEDDPNHMEPPVSLENDGEGHAELPETPPGEITRMKESPHAPIHNETILNPSIDEHSVSELSIVPPDGMLKHAKPPISSQEQYQGYESTKYRLPESSLQYPKSIGEELEDAEYTQNDNEDYDNLVEFEEDKQDNGSAFSTLPGPVRPLMNIIDKYKKFTFNNNQTGDKENSQDDDDYEDEDYEDKDDDNDEGDGSHDY